MYLISILKLYMCFNVIVVDSKFKISILFFLLLLKKGYK